MKALLAAVLPVALTISAAAAFAVGVVIHAPQLGQLLTAIAMLFPVILTALLVTEHLGRRRIR